MTDLNMWRTKMSLQWLFFILSTSVFVFVAFFVAFIGASVGLEEHRQHLLVIGVWVLWWWFLFTLTPFQLADRLADWFGKMFIKPRRHSEIPGADNTDAVNPADTGSCGSVAGCLHNWGDWAPYGEYGDASESIARCTKCPDSIVVSDRRYR